MATHSGCFWDYPEDVVLTYGKVRGLRLVLANATDDSVTRDEIFDEVGDCAQCLRNLIGFLTSLAESLGATVARMAGADHEDAVQRWEEMLADAERELPSDQP